MTTYAAAHLREITHLYAEQADAADKLLDSDINHTETEISTLEISHMLAANLGVFAASIAKDLEAFANWREPLET